MHEGGVERHRVEQGLQVGDGVGAGANLRRVAGRRCLEANFLDPQPLASKRGGLRQHLFAQLRLVAEQLAVRGAATGQRDPHRPRSGVGRSRQQRFERAADQANGSVQIDRRRHVDRDALPAHHIDDEALDRDDAGLVSVHQHRAARAGLADAAALQVAGEHDPRVAQQHGVFVHMAECPVGVALRFQLVERARRVTRVRGVAFKRGVQHADVEPAGHRSGIVDGQVLERRRILEAAPVQRHTQ